MKISTLIKKILPYFYLIIYLISTALILFKSAETGDVSAKQSSSFAEYLQNNVIGMDKIAEKSEDFPTLGLPTMASVGFLIVNYHPFC